MLERLILLAVIALAGSPALLLLLRRVGGLLAQSLAPPAGSCGSGWEGLAP